MPAKVPTSVSGSIRRNTSMGALAGGVRFDLAGGAKEQPVVQFTFEGEDGDLQAGLGWRSSIQQVLDARVVAGLGMGHGAALNGQRRTSYG